jgi:hypothetical protein
MHAFWDVLLGWFTAQTRRQSNTRLLRGNGKVGLRWQQLVKLWFASVWCSGWSGILKKRCKY